MGERLGDLWRYVFDRAQHDPMERITSPDRYWDRLSPLDQRICLWMTGAIIVIEWTLILSGMWIAFSALKWTLS